MFSCKTGNLSSSNLSVRHDLPYAELLESTEAVRGVIGALFCHVVEKKYRALNLLLVGIEKGELTSIAVSML